MTCSHLIRRRRGFTLVEIAIALVVAAIVATLALPSFAGAMHRARRTDGVAALLQLDFAQQRHRGEHAAFAATLAELRTTERSTLGHYRLEIVDHGAVGYEALAEAIGAQADDRACRWLRLKFDGGSTTFESGPDRATRNAPAANRRCWNQA